MAHDRKKILGFTCLVLNSGISAGRFSIADTRLGLDRGQENLEVPTEEAGHD